MKIAIISDTHDNLPNIRQFLIWAKKNKIEMIIHCGDIATAETVKALAKFDGPVKLVFGNMDLKRDETIKAIDQHKNMSLAKEVGKIIIDGIKIGYCHKPQLAKLLADTGDYDLIFYGHTHRPWTENYNGQELINPGNLAGQRNKASFATYDTKTGQLELKILEQL